MRGKRRRVSNKTCLVRVLVDGEPTRRVTKGMVRKGRMTIVTRFYYYKKKGHIQMMCKEIKKDLKTRSLEDGGKKGVEAKGKATLGFVEDDDDCKSLLFVD